MRKNNSTCNLKKTWQRLFGLCVILIGLNAEQSHAQLFGNEWIDSNQEYYKLTVAEDGFYRVDYNELSQAGFPVNTIDPRRIQLFYKGEEQAIFINGQQDGSFDANDYIEFWGKKNDGTADTELYVASEAQPHTHYNLFSDTSAYFLTYKLSADNGLRMANYFENNVDNLPEEEYNTRTLLNLFTTSYAQGKSYGASNDVVLSQYDHNEGWTGGFFTRGQAITHTINDITNRLESGPKPQLEIMLAGGNNNTHRADIFIGPSSGALRNIGSVEFIKDETFLFSATIEWTDISADGELFISVSVNGADGKADRIALSYVQLAYAHNFDVNEKDNRKLVLQANPTDKSFIKISNPAANSRLWDITEETTPVRIGANASFQQLTAVVRNTQKQRTLWLQSTVKQVARLEKTAFVNINPADYNYLIVTHNQLQKNTTSGSGNPVEAYKTYRESAAGGGYKVLVLNMEQVYNQFNYGLTSPLAIRRYCHFMLNSGLPEHLFLIGRALNNGFDYFRKDPATAEATNFVPTFGHPGSDIAFTAGLNGSTLEEAIATGRINAKTPDDVEAYLNKVKESEGQPYNDLWHKNLLHLTGGQNESELIRFRNYGEEFEAIAEGPLLGGKVAKTSKKTNDAVEFFNVTQEINNGVSLITFFGHSGASVTDIEIGIVSDPKFGYNNKGRYPVFLINGCNAGDFFSVAESFGIDWVLTPNLGALGFMAHSSLAFSGNLRNYTLIFYDLAFADENFFGKPMGTIKQEVSKRYATRFGSSVFSASQVQQFILQGDPAVKVFAADKPDFDVVEETLTAGTFDDTPLLASAPSFYIDIDVKNYGKYVDDPFLISVKRTLPNGSTLTYGPELYDPVLRRDTLRFVIDNDIDGKEGNNTFEIILDQDNLIDELNENNNSANLNLFLASGSTFNILPQNYSIVNSSTVEFSFQSTDLLSTKRDFLLEIDTTSTFNSAYLIQRNVTEKVVSKLSIDLEQTGSLPDGTVVYWRTKFANPLPSESAEWVTSSFVLQPTGEGWHQSDHDQLQQTARTGLTFDSNTGMWDFEENNTSLELNIYGPDHPTFTHEDTRYLLDGVNFFKTNAPSDPGCRNNTINIVAFDFQSTVPYKPVSFGRPDVLNSQVCGKVPQTIYNFQEAEFGGSINPEVVLDNIKDRDNVLVFSLGSLNYSAWPAGLKTKLTEIGVDQSTLDNLEDGEPIILFGTKGQPQGTATVVTSTDTPKQEQEVLLTDEINGKFFSGKIVSEKIGPALSYYRFTHTLDMTGSNSDDTFGFTIYGIDAGGNETLLLEDIQITDVDLSGIDATDYPYLRLQLALEDKTDLTPLQLRQWQITYTEAQEGILLKRDREGVDTPLNRQEGQPTTARFTYWNLSAKNYPDSVKVHYEIFNQEQSKVYADSLKLKPLNPNDSVNFELDIPTLGHTGMNDFTISVNENDQPETHQNNNTIRMVRFMEVNADNTNPILEVAFDGVFIMDGDIVSPTPHIQVVMKDENEYLYKQDTTGINLFVKRPCEGCDFERIAFSSAEVAYQPASESSDFTINYNPETLENGRYALRVQTTDESGNASGTEPYEINFEVVNESTITNFYPYPNPFSSHTRFVFTLTGQEVPDDIKIQIMTVTGRVVREILREELGNIRIGNNITEYAWDGRDEYGDQLANGVYLYKVYIKQNGEPIDHRDTAGDKGFKNGFGKMYLLR